MILNYVIYKFMHAIYYDKKYKEYLRSKLQSMIYFHKNFIEVRHSIQH